MMYFDHFLLGCLLCALIAGGLAAMYLDYVKKEEDLLRQHMAIQVAPGSRCCQAQAPARQCDRVRPRCKRPLVSISPPPAIIVGSAMWKKLTQSYKICYTGGPASLDPLSRLLARRVGNADAE